MGSYSPIHRTQEYDSSAEPLMTGTNIDDTAHGRASTEVLATGLLLDVFYTSEASICIAVRLEITGAP